MGALFYVLVASLFFEVYMLIKCEVAFRQQVKIINAIGEFAEDGDGNYGEALRILSELEGLEDTMWRLWDWGYKNILPKDDYELIKPYMH